MKHIEGETIAVRDCVLLKSGPNSDDIPYLAKITALWEKDGKWDHFYNCDELSLIYSFLKVK